jgi:single-strand DNA-binding protein
VSRGFQLVVATGYLRDDAKLMAFAGGGLVAELTVAVTETFTNRSGAEEEHTEWVDVKVFGRSAEVAGKFATRGRLVTIEGRLHTERWKDANDRPQKRTYVYARNRGLTLHGKDEHTQTHARRQRQAAPVTPDFDPSTTEGARDDVNW